ncbi:Cation-dependent mannose-6-phosphate receptor precursor, putative [Pediculus humanus corporis]|uniref:Cation-dependent mannose-6-phosphate receptor, putative n=1 Tax=Pediculus humanus subsp. corporis TaxID=121224 RepID=E0VXD0_PEDHC|nr:Cation-dependent mannose-6-phosphate receptor precursor, putative [Pediculus humanus corporis]EEB18036.1 Cation-dependent mannose-6-phosphate receptor precursor, putative [Pediculus humanus corporis]
MHTSCFNLFILSFLTHFFSTVLCSDAGKYGFSYSVGICADTSKLANVSVSKTKASEEPIPLGRRNETQIMGGDTWVMVQYGCSHCLPSTQCLGNRNVSIYIVCDPIHHDNHKLQLAVENDCYNQFVLPTSFICTHEEKVSGTSVFFILLSVGFFMYFLVGVIYRKLAHNAQGCQQLPHFRFWQRIGGLCSDGCNYVCRCDTEPEDSWNNITSNFDGGDRDDALLKP